MVIEYYGNISLLTGKQSEELGFSATVHEAIEQLELRYPEIKKEGFMIMVNKKFVNRQFPLSPDDIISLISIVDGG
jgi:molybdopterin converting factor small subunit